MSPDLGAHGARGRATATALRNQGANKLQQGPLDKAWGGACLGAIISGQGLQGWPLCFVLYLTYCVAMAALRGQRRGQTMALEYSSTVQTLNVR